MNFLLDRPHGGTRISSLHEVGMKFEGKRREVFDSPARQSAQGELDGNGRASTGLAVDRDASLVRLDNLLDDGEAQPEPFRPAASSIAAAVEALESMSNIVRRHARS